MLRITWSYSILDHREVKQLAMGEQSSPPVHQVVASSTYMGIQCTTTEEPQWYADHLGMASTSSY